MPSNTVCNKCLEAIPKELILESSLAESGEPTYREDCAAEERSNLSPIADYSSSQSRLCRDTSNPNIWTAVSVTGISSKIESVVKNLILLEQRRYPGFKPVKR